MCTHAHATIRIRCMRQRHRHCRRRPPHQSLSLSLSLSPSSLSPSFFLRLPGTQVSRSARAAAVVLRDPCCVPYNGAEAESIEYVCVCNRIRECARARSVRWATTRATRQHHISHRKQARQESVRRPTRYQRRRADVVVVIIERSEGRKHAAIRELPSTLSQLVGPSSGRAVAHTAPSILSVVIVIIAFPPQNVPRADRHLAPRRWLVVRGPRPWRSTSRDLQRLRHRIRGGRSRRSGSRRGRGRGGSVGAAFRVTAAAAAPDL